MLVSWLLYLVLYLLWPGAHLNLFVQIFLPVLYDFMLCSAVRCCAVLCAVLLGKQLVHLLVQASSPVLRDFVFLLQAVLVCKQCVRMPIQAFLTPTLTARLWGCAVLCCAVLRCLQSCLANDMCTCLYRLPYLCCKTLILRQHRHSINSAALAQQSSKPFLRWMHCLKI